MDNLLAEIEATVEKTTRSSPEKIKLIAESLLYRGFVLGVKATLTAQASMRDCYSEEESAREMDRLTRKIHEMVNEANARGMASTLAAANEDPLYFGRKL